MYQGDTKVLSKGVYGKADVTANVTIINGEETAREYVASVTLSQPVAEVQARGTKVRPTWFPTGSFRWPCYGVITSYFGPAGPAWPAPPPIMRPWTSPTAMAPPFTPPTAAP